MKFLSRLKNVIPHRFTFLLVPHGPGNPRHINIRLSQLLFLLAAWTGITFWGSYLSARHVDYWRAQLSNQVLKMKVNYLVAQLDKSRGFIDEVKEVQVQLHEILRYSDDATATGKAQTAGLATGGPTIDDANDLVKALESSDPDISWKRITEKVGLMESEATERITKFAQLKTWVQGRRKLYRATPIGWPCKGHLSSHFGKRQSPITGGEEYHAGVDISAETGTPIQTTADGIVRIASWNSGYGNLVVVEHGFGYFTRYGHNSKILVRVGDRVKRGDVLALMGQTGRASGPHCHYEVWRYDQRKNPYTFFKDIQFESPVLSKLVKDSQSL